MTDRRESRLQTIIKAFTWRFIATTTTMALAYYATGSLAIAGAIDAVDVVIKLFFYYAHERARGRVSWGRNVRFPKG